MNRKSFPVSCPCLLVGAVLAGLGGVPHLSNAAESASASTNARPAALEALVADVLEHNPELNFYRAEIDAAKGERRAATTWANPELSSSVGQKRDPAGLTPQLETRIIEATELTLQRKATEAQLASQAALLELNQLRGQPWTRAMKVESVRLAFVAAPDSEILLAAAQTNNFELQMRRVELEQQGFKVSLARKDGYPSLTVGPYFSQERAGDREQQIGVGISLPLPLWNRNKGNVQTAEARRTQAETLAFVAQRDLDRRIIQTALAYQTKLAEMGKWRPESVDEFRKAAELADRHYRLGAVPIATYVELQKQYLEAVEALLDTRRDALEAGQELQRLTGLEFKAVQTVTPDKSPNP